MASTALPLRKHSNALTLLAGTRDLQSPVKALQFRQSTRFFGKRRSTSQDHCNELIASLQHGEKVDLQMQFENLLEYKGHHLTGTVLHYSVHLAANEANDDARAGIVRLILEKKADIYEKAHYDKGNTRIHLHAVHIAAGLGCVPALQALLEESNGRLTSNLSLESVRRQNFLDTYCTQCHRDGISGSTFSEPTKYYAPIHDAAYCGQKDALRWLLMSKADPKLENFEHYTALHWLVSTAQQNSEEDLKLMVRSLVKHKARLDAKAKPKAADTANVLMTPLEMAVSSESRFPVHLTYLLAPSFQCRMWKAKKDVHEVGFMSTESLISDPTTSRAMRKTSDDSTDPSFFDDLCTLASHSTRAAEDFAQQIAASKNSSVLMKKLRMDAQKTDAADRIASLIHAAPQAAVLMLQLLTVRPMVKMPKYSISCRASMSGWFGNVSMRCAYQTDAHVNEVSGMKWPEWRCEFDIEGGEHEKAWHNELVRKPARGERSAHIYDVDTKVLLLPNILDVDLFRALACVSQTHIRVFAALQVQAAITCVWEHLVQPAFCTSLVFEGGELLVMACWGMTPANENLASRLWLDAPSGTERRANSPVDWPIIYSILMAGLLRDTFTLIWWFGAHCSKWGEHKCRFEVWQHNSKHDHRPPGLHALWNRASFIYNTSATPELWVCAVKFVFLYASSAAVLCPGGAKEMTRLQQGLLSMAFLAQFFKVMYSLRTSFTGERIIPILFMFANATVCEMLILTFIFFVAVNMAFMMIDRQDSLTWIAIYAFRGLIFSDGDGLDELGLGESNSIREDHQSRELKTTLMVVSTVFFNIMVVNLIIAIFSSQYEQLENRGSLLFQKERAKVCCKYLLGHLKIKSRTCAGGVEKRIMWLKVAVFASFGIAVLVVKALLDDVNGNYLQRLSLTFMVLLAFAQITMHELQMQKNWTKNFGADGCDGPDTDRFQCLDQEEGWESDHERLDLCRDRFLWICHRADCQDEWHECDGELRDTPYKMQDRLAHLESKLDSLADNVDLLLKRLPE